MREWQPCARCLVCGYPAQDHTPLRYVLRAGLLHLLPARIARWLRPLPR